MFATKGGLRGAINGGGDRVRYKSPIDAKPKMLATRKARWRKFLADSQTQWSSWRDEECQDLAPLEQAGAPGDPRAACLIEHNQRRAADLRARYP